MDEDDRCAAGRVSLVDLIQGGGWDLRRGFRRFAATSVRRVQLGASLSDCHPVSGVML